MDEVIIETNEIDEINERVAIVEHYCNTFTVSPIEESVIKAAINGDEKGFETLFMGTYRYVFSTVKKYLKNDQDIYDAIQDTYTKVYKGISRLESVSSFYPWLHRISENCAKDVLRFSNYDVITTCDDAVVEVSEDDQSDRSNVSVDVAEVLKQLPKEQSELLVRVYYDRMRVAEIARMQGIPVTTVYNRLKAAKKKLKELLKIRGIDKPIYGGEFVSVISSAIRNAIGTQLLSMAVAEEILHNVINSKNQKGAFVVSAIARNMRNKAAGKIATILLLFCVFIIAIIFLVLAITTKMFSAPSSGGAKDEPIKDNSIILINSGTTSETESISETESSSTSSSQGASSNNTTSNDNTSSANQTSSYDFYFSTMTEDVPLMGAFTNTEVFGTHTENEELDIAALNDKLYAVVKGNLISLDAGDTTPTVIIKDFNKLYGDGKCLNVYNSKVYWVNTNSEGRFVLNRCDINGTNRLAVVFSEECTYVTKMIVAKDGVYFCAGKHGDFNYIESGVLYKTDYDFNVINRYESVADYALLNDKIFILYGKGNRGMPYSIDRATFKNLINITEDHLTYSSIYAMGEYIVLDACSPYQHSEFGGGNDLKIMDTTTNKIVRAIFAEAGEILDIKDVSEFNGGTVLYRYNDNPMTMNIKTGQTELVENYIGTVAKGYKYYIESNCLYVSGISGKSPEKIY